MTGEESGRDAREMSLVAHLTELRGAVIRILAGLVAVFLVLLPFNRAVYAFFARPVLDNLLPGQRMLAHQPVSVLLTPIKVCLFLAVLATIPWTLYQIWRFVAPGMYRNERRMILPMLVSGTALFYLGVLFAYFVILPLLFHFLGGIELESVAFMPDITSYVGLSLKMFMAFGIVFEVPVVTVIIVLLDVVRIETLTAKRAYVVLIAFTVGMLLTPPDIFSQTLLAVPMLILFEIGIFVARRLKKRRAAAARERGRGG